MHESSVCRKAVLILSSCQPALSLAVKKTIKYEKVHCLHQPILRALFLQYLIVGNNKHILQGVRKPTNATNPHGLPAFMSDLSCFCNSPSLYDSTFSSNTFTNLSHKRLLFDECLTNKKIKLAHACYS